MYDQEKNIYHAILITSLVIGTIIIYFIISITRQQRKNLELHQLNILAEITTLEKERARIASDLHDELGPVLSAIKMKINSFELHNPQDKIQLEKTNEHIDEILNRIRGIAFDLMPYSLLRKGLITALKEFIDYLNYSNPIKFVFESSQEIELAELKAVNIYRIVQEIAHNCIKHSRASNFSLSVSVVKDFLILMISDNGIGFDPQKESFGSIGFGLRGILSRTELIGGKVYLDSIPGEGTTYHFEIPI